MTTYLLEGTDSANRKSAHISVKYVSVNDKDIHKNVFLWFV